MSLDWFRRLFQRQGTVISPVEVERRDKQVSGPRGLRNANPTNLRYTGDQWQGLRGVDPDGFCMFDTPQNGIRAGCIVLRNYERKYHLDTVRMIINRWAPPTENNTGAYVAAVAKALNVDPDSRIDVHDRATLSDLVRAIIKHENGVQPFMPSLIMAGVDAALRA